MSEFRKPCIGWVWFWSEGQELVERAVQSLDMSCTCLSVKRGFVYHSFYDVLFVRLKATGLAIQWSLIPESRSRDPVISRFPFRRCLECARASFLSTLDGRQHL